MAHHVLVDDFTIDLRVVQHVRTWTDDAHVTSEHIEELRELVDVGLAHEVAEGELPWVVLGGLRRVGILVDVHGAELIAIERLAVQTRASLLEEQRSWALQLDDECDDGEERQHAQADHAAHGNVEGTFHDAVADVGERFCMIGIDRLPHERARVEVQLVFTKLAWQVVEVYHVLVAVLDELDDEVGVVVRQTAEYLFRTDGNALDGVVERGVQNLVDVLHVAEPLESLGSVLDVAVGVVALDVIASRRVFGHQGMHFQDGRVVADEHGSPAVVPLRPVVLQHAQLADPRQEQDEIERDAEDDVELEETATVADEADEEKEQGGGEQRQVESPLDDDGVRYLASVNDGRKAIFTYT